MGTPPPNTPPPSHGHNYLYGAVWRHVDTAWNKLLAHSAHSFTSYLPTTTGNTLMLLFQTFVCWLHVKWTLRDVRNNCICMYMVAHKLAQLYALTLSHINRFLKLFHCQKQEKICNNAITKDPTTPKVCCYTTLWNVSVGQTVAAFHWSCHWSVASSAWMRRPPARQIHGTFDVKKTAGCDSYFTQ